MADALELAFDASRDWLAGLDTRPVAAIADLHALRSAFGGAMPERGTSPEEVVQALLEGARPGLLGSAGGRFFAWVIGGGLTSALAADWLVSTWDQNAALHACSPASAVIEDIAGAWLKEALDLPREASFAFTTGCQLAHVTCLAAARHAVLARATWDVENDGLAGAPAVGIFASDQNHGSVPRAVRLLGFGRRALKSIPTDAQGCIVRDALDSALRAHAGPAIVVLNAADLNIGAFDDFGSLIPLAHSHGAWVHIDGAFGLMARASAYKRHLLEGVERADSWATDAHKWLNVPFDCGVAIIRHPEAHRAAMTISADYVAPAAEARDQIDWNPEWSRRARGVPVYAALKQLGRSGLEALIDRCCTHAASLVEGIGAAPGARILWRPTLNQGLLRFERIGGDRITNDAFTDEVIASINATGEAFFSGTTWRGERAMRVSVVNWRTDERDVARAVAAAHAVLAGKL